MPVKILGAGSLPNIPWQDKPADHRTAAPVWRYTENSVMGRNPTPEIARIANPFIPFNRNAVLFPRKIGGMYKMMSRPSESGHTPFGDIFVSESPDMEYWGHHRHVMGRGPSGGRASNVAPARPH